MSRFLKALYSERVLLMDGAMGTQLQRAGLRPGEPGAQWNLTHPEKVRAIHEAYLAAGADCLLTNTFQSNPAALARHGLDDQVEAINQAAIALARSARGGRPFVLADVGPMHDEGEGASDGLGDPDILRRTVRTLLDTDALLFETWSDPVALLKLSSIIGPVLDLAGLPTLLSLTYSRRDGAQRGLWSHSGHPPEWFAMQARHSGIAALGVNCGRDVGMDEIIDIVRRYRQVTDLPLFARPNAGTPSERGDEWLYPRTPAEMAERAEELLEAGATMIGGCCGTTPEHIAAFRTVIDNWNARHPTKQHQPET
jgi:5-methyltetrahydrofolate--homocysteine methyltransferase